MGSIELKDIDEERIVELLLGHLSYSALERLNDKIDDEANGLIRDHVESRLRELTDERVGAIVQDVIENGVPETNNYGEPTGKRISVRGRIMEFFEKKHSRGYNRPSTSEFEELVKGQLDRNLSKAFSVELKAAQEQIRSAVDGLIKEKLTATLKSALGLR
jgi:DNA helicase IV